MRGETTQVTALGRLRLALCVRGGCVVRLVVYTDYVGFEF